eukprot:TRINITY_DN2532_c0_g3_i1.p1 TRINITY_DN2532_c0_g3~~TRINITY_DN2532_c0_g3_i1.p1  ORF type:complete len:145 (+),score=29.30 TRINITY_DN2532_c0_g3_i1:314-748(+)
MEAEDLVIDSVLEFGEQLEDLLTDQELFLMKFKSASGLSDTWYDFLVKNTSLSSRGAKYLRKLLIKYADKIGLKILDQSKESILVDIETTLRLLVMKLKERLHLRYIKSDTVRHVCNTLAFKSMVDETESRFNDGIPTFVLGKQ